MIKQIAIHNFKSLKDISFSLSNLNLLTGLNGMGKTSFIQSLLLLRQNVQNGLSRLELNGPYTQIGKGRDVMYQDSDQEIITFRMLLQGINGQELDLNCTWNYSAESDFLTAHKKYEPAILNQFSLFNDHFQYIEAERTGPRLDYFSSSIDVEKHRQLGLQGEFTPHYLNFFSTQPIPQRLHHPQAKSPTLIHQTDAWMSEISPGVKLNTKEIPETGKIVLDFQFEKGDQYSNHYRPTNVGFGISYALPVVVALLTSSRDKIIILENPESHIHPRGQAELGKLIALAAANGAQLFVETHSDHIINGVRVAVKEKSIEKEKVRIAYFRKETTLLEQYSVIDPIAIDENGELSDYPQDFMDEWNNQLLKLI